MKLYNFFAFFIFISSSVCAQQYKDSLHGKAGEHNEIRATNHLKKELEQKQLSAPPERIADTTAVLKTQNKTKNKNCRPATLKRKNKYGK